MAYKNYSVANGVIVDASGHGDFLTWSAAIAAVSSGTIFVRAGTYTENPTLKGGLNICAFETDGFSETVTLLGTVTMSYNGESSISGINFETNSGYSITTSGSNSGQLNILNSNLDITNHTAINVGSGYTVTVYNASGDIGTTGITLFNNAGTLTFQSSNFSNSGASTTASTCTAGYVSFVWSGVDNPVTTSGTASLASLWSQITSVLTNETALTLGGSGPHSLFCSNFYSGTATTVVINNTVTSDFCTYGTSGSTAISGSGVYIYGSNTYPAGVAVTCGTLTPQSTGPIIYTNGLSFDTGTNVLATYAASTFTPTVTGGTTAGTTTYTFQAGSYRKIGDMVYVEFNAQYNNATGTGNIVLGGLPFTSDASAGQTGSALVSGPTYPVGGTDIVVSVQPGSKEALLYTNITSSGVSPIQIAGSTNVAIVFSMWYRASS